MTTKSIWLTGASGRLGQELLKVLEEDSHNKIVATDQDVDITNKEAVEHAMDVYRPTVVINCASISDAAYCESHKVEAFRVNALGARNVASASRRINAKIIQLSTDDVFEGKAYGEFNEFDETAPKTIYGQSKLAGEMYVRELNPKHLIIRSSWVYGAGANDYFSKVAEHGKKGEPFDSPLNVVSTPTSAATLARLIVSLLDKTEYGVFHASCEGSCTRHDFAAAILEELGYDPALARGISSDKPEDASSTILENLMLQMTGICEMPQWREDLRAFAQTVKENRA